METKTKDNQLADLAGNGNNGSLNGGIIIGDSDGKIGKTSSFNESSKYFSINHNNILNPGTNNFTINIWVKIPTLSNNHVFISKGYNSGKDHYLISQIEGNKLSLYLTNDGGPDITIAGFFDNSTLNTWTSITITYNNAQTIKVYKNNLLVNTTNMANLNINNTNNLFIGAYKDEDNGNIAITYGGLLDELRIYNRALSDEEIKALYEASK